jgi:hypothetical protein
MLVHTNLDHAPHWCVAIVSRCYVVIIPHCCIHTTHCQRAPHWCIAWLGSDNGCLGAVRCHVVIIPQCCIGATHRVCTYWHRIVRCRFTMWNEGPFLKYRPPILKTFDWAVAPCQRLNFYSFPSKTSVFVFTVKFFYSIRVNPIRVNPYVLGHHCQFDSLVAVFVAVF